MKVKCFSFIILLIVWLRIQYVVSSDYDDMGVSMLTKNKPVLEPLIPSGNPNPQVTKINNCPIPKYGVYIMGFTIGLLFLIIIALLILLYKLKHKVYSESIGDKIEITKTDSSTKYTRQSSLEANSVTYSRENSNNNGDGRFKLHRQGSKMTIVDYPTSYNTNEKKNEEPHNSTVTLSKIMHQQPVQIEKDRMKKICEAVLSKKQRWNASTTSLANLEKILNEDGKSEETETYTVVDKSASTGLLDVVEDYKILPSPLPTKKTNVLCDHAQTSVAVENQKIDNSAANIDICDDPPQSTRRVKMNSCDGENVDDIYDNPPVFNRSVSHGDCEHADDIYDNPPSTTRPVTDNDDVYDNIPNNRPLFASSDLNDIKANLQRNKIALALKSQGVEEQNIEEYDFPPQACDNYFDAFYSNAKSLNQRKA